MDPWIFGEPSIDGQDPEMTSAILRNLSSNFFPSLEPTKDFHVTLLCIGNDHSEHIEDLIEVFQRQGIHDLSALTDKYHFMLGSENNDMLLMVLDMPDLNEAFKRLYDAYEEINIFPKHTLFPEDGGRYGYTPHITLGKFTSAESANREFNDLKRLSAFTMEMRKSAFLIEVQNFHLFQNNLEPII